MVHEAEEEWLQWVTRLALSPQESLLMLSLEDRELLESQRRRASFSSWLMLGLGAALLIAGPFLTLGNSFGELESGPAGILLKKIHGPGPSLLWLSAVALLFRQFLHDKKRARELEDRQNRERHIRLNKDIKLAEDALRLIEHGPGASKPVQEKPPPARVIIHRVGSQVGELKSVNHPIKELPALPDPEGSSEK